MQDVHGQWKCCDERSAGMPLGASTQPHVRSQLHYNPHAARAEVHLLQPALRLGTAMDGGTLAFRHPTTIKGQKHNSLQSSQAKALNHPHRLTHHLSAPKHTTKHHNQTGQQPTMLICQLLQMQMRMSGAVCI